MIFLSFLLNIVIFLIWLYILSVLKRSGTAGFAYFFGSVTTIIFLVVYCSDLVLPIVSQVTLSVVKFFGDLTGFYETYVNYGMICVNTDGQLQMYLDYECAGVFEIFAFASSALFFPLYKDFKKISVVCGGIVWVILCNVIRLLFISFSTAICGTWFYEIAHGFIGRIFIFYPLIIFMWWKLFTRPQILAQKVGDFTYD